ncbi:thioredoxin family protein, partial [Stenotrophomonas sp. A3_2]|uniref:thioredoxin family protein n=1 Tax=Stenotrophomonas sp. A3_2 TaxID=3119978 RepID=UPI002FC3828D
KSFLVLFFKKELLLFLLVAAAPRLPDGPPPEIDHPYAIVAAHAQVDAALADARRTRRIVLLEFGANWCADCRILAGVFAMSALRDWMASRFLLVQVNVGRFDRNMDI